MAEKRYYWVFDRNLFDQIKLPEFTLLEGALIVASLVALGLYVMVIVYLDAVGKRRVKRRKQLAWLGRWLEHARLNEQEEANLDLLVGSKAPIDRYQLLSSPIRFEPRLHEALAGGNLIDPAFAEKIRDKLRFTSQNLRVPVVSTRQFVPGDPIRISFSRGGMPHHYYGKVIAAGLRTFAVTVHPEAVKNLTAEGGEADLFYIRGQGLEYPFAHVMSRPGTQPDQLVLRHTLARGGQSPRMARLPVMVEVVFRTRSFAMDKTGEVQPDGAPSAPRRGLLLDLSTGGFCMAHRDEIPVGGYIDFRLPLKKGKGKLALTGKVRHCRPFSSDEWLSRCELRGLDKDQRGLLGQVVRLEHHNRLKVLAPIRRRAAKAG